MAEETNRKRKRDPSESLLDVVCKKFNGELQQEEVVPRLSRPDDCLCDGIRVKDVSELLHYVLLRKHLRVKKPSWCRVHQKDRVEKVHVVVLEGVAQLHFYTHYSQFKHLRSKYTTRCTLAPPSGDILSELFDSELSAADRSAECRSALYKAPPTGSVGYHPVIRRYGMKKNMLRNFLLTAQEMNKHNFPVKGGRSFESFVCTQAEDHVTNSSPLYGLDCEMCVTQEGPELTRVAMVTSSGECVLDELVKPFNAITNYCTKFSGITRAMLKNVRTRLQDVQKNVLTLLPGNAVLVGHALDNDLRALRLIHPHVIDTSLLYRKDFGQKFKLKQLAKVILNREIQNEQSNGHDPCEDAQAALDLAHYFISNGPRRAVERHLQDLWGVEPLAVNGAVNGPLHTDTTSSVLFGHALHKAGVPALFLGQLAALNNVSSNHLSRKRYCNSDKESVCVFQRACESYALSVVQFTSLSEHLRKNPAGGTHTLHQMALRLKQMCVLFVGPLPHTYTEKDIHTLLKPYGALRLVRLLHSTHTLHAVVEFQHLEGVHLALRSHTNLQVEGIMFKRPVNELTLDLDVSLTELQNDIQNSHMIYVGRLPWRHIQQLLQAFSAFGPVSDLTTNKDSGKCQTHTRFKFVSRDCAAAALDTAVQMGNRKLNVCRALTPSHMRTWTHTNPVTMEPKDEEQPFREEAESVGLTCTQDEGMQHVMRRLDRNVGKMFRTLERHTLSIVILPGVIRDTVEYPGLCFIQVKEI